MLEVIGFLGAVLTGIAMMLTGFYKVGKAVLKRMGRG